MAYQVDAKDDPMPLHSLLARCTPGLLLILTAAG